MSRWRLFPGAIFALLGLNVCIVAVTIYFAHNSGAAPAEPNYYQRALRWDDVKREREREHRLGWSIGVGVGEEPLAGQGRRIEVVVTDRDGRGVEGASLVLTAFHNAHASRPVTLGLSPVEGGRYSVVAPLAPHGLWQFRISAVRGGDRATLERQVRVEPARREIDP